MRSPRISQTRVAVKIRPDQLLEFGGVEAIEQCVPVGMGIMVPPGYAVAAGLTTGTLVGLGWPAAGVAPATSVGDAAPDVVTPMARREGRRVAPAPDAVIRLAREVLGPDTDRTTDPA